MRRLLLNLVFLLGGCTVGPITVQAPDSNEALSIRALFKQETPRFFAMFPEAKISWREKPCTVLPSYKDLEEYAQRVEHVNASWMQGYYSANHNRIIVVTGRSDRVLSHEFAHQLAYLGGLWREKFWFNEGLAMNFERDSDQPFRDRLHAMKKTDRLIPLATFGQMSGPNDEIFSCYAEAWGVFHFLLQSHRVLLFDSGEIDLGSFQQEFDQFIDSLEK
jgi:hypothetical protein